MTRLFFAADSRHRGVVPILVWCHKVGVLYDAAVDQEEEFLHAHHLAIGSAIFGDGKVFELFKGRETAFLVI